MSTQETTIMNHHHRHTTTVPAAAAIAELVAAGAEVEGDCPSCGKGPWLLTTAGQVPEHRRYDRRAANGGYRRCPCSGWLAVNVRPRTHFYVEGAPWAA
jgi:hypothetical protein